jgi:RNA polymerase sigma factor (sigma-70 family)
MDGKPVSSEAGLDAVFMANRLQILRFVRARGAGDDAEDMVQELWLKASTLQSGPIAEPLSYLYRMADNLLLDRRRSQQRRARREEAYSGLDQSPVPGASEAPSVERALVALERLRFVEATLAALGHRTATIFRRYRIDGVSQRDIGAELGLSLSAVEKHLQKAYRALIDIRAVDDAESAAPRRLAVRE